MKSFKNKKKSFNFGDKISSTIFAFGAFFLIVFLTISVIRIYQKRSDLKIQIRDKEQEITELSEKIKDIRFFEEDEFDDDYHLEKIAREQLLLKKEGEEVVFIALPEEKEEDLEEGKEESRLKLMKDALIDKIKTFFSR